MSSHRGSQIIVRNPHRLTQGPFTDPIPWQQKPRTVVHSQIFWLNMGVNFASVTGENATSATEPEGFDCLVTSAWSDLTQARVRITEGESDRQWSSIPIPIRSIAGNSNEVRPLLPLVQPVLLEAKATLKGDWVNTGTEPAGRANFYTKKVGLDPSGHPYEGAIRVTRSMFFDLLLDLSQVRSTTDPVNSDILIWGASTNVPNSIIGRITNQSSNYSWSSLDIPIRSMCGVDGMPEPIMYYPYPYLLGNNIKLEADTSAAVSGGYICFRAERILE